MQNVKRGNATISKVFKIGKTGKAEYSNYLQ